jgi:hypothetical protein
MDRSIAANNPQDLGAFKTARLDGRRNGRRRSRARPRVGGQHFLLFGHDHRAPLRAHHDPVFQVLELGHGDDALAAPGRLFPLFVYYPS